MTAQRAVLLGWRVWGWDRKSPMNLREREEEVGHGGWGRKVRPLEGLSLRLGEVGSH